MKTLKKTFHIILPLLSLVLLVLLWLLAAQTVPDFPSPADVVERFGLLNERPISDTGILGHVWASLQRVLKALGLSILIGIPFGLLIGWNKTFRGLFKPLFEVFRPIPPIAWIPLISLWLGVGETSKVLIIFIGTVMPIVVNTYSGVAMVPSQFLDASRSFGATHKQVLVDIVMPAALQSIFAGIKTALSAGWMVVLAAEMISAKQGLGFLITRGSDTNDLALCVISMIFIGIIGAIISYGFDFVERRLCPWIEK